MLISDDDKIEMKKLNTPLLSPLTLVPLDFLVCQASVVMEMVGEGKGWAGFAIDSGYVGGRGGNVVW